MNERNRVIEGGAIEQISRAEIDMQISTAKKYPRHLERCRQEMRQAALRTEDAAAECSYSLPRKDRKTGEVKEIIGPSIRFAEILYCSWGNLRVATRIMDTGERTVTVAAHCHDLEKNNAVTCEVSRRITTRDGDRFNDDLINVTINAAMAIARRNAILATIPQTEWSELFEETLRIKRGIGDRAAAKPAEALAIKARAIKAFANLGISERQILEKLGAPSVEEITGEQLATLRGIYTAIRDEQTTLEEQFGRVEDPFGEPAPVPGPSPKPEPTRQNGQEGPQPAPGVRRSRPLRPDTHPGPGGERQGDILAGGHPEPGAGG